MRVPPDARMDYTAQASRRPLPATLCSRAAGRPTGPIPHGPKAPPRGAEAVSMAGMAREEPASVPQLKSLLVPYPSAEMQYEFCWLSK
jgi:hypothetical protein